MSTISTALLVDDDDVFRTTLQSSLRRRGVLARTAATVEEGRIVLEEEAVDLVVLDYRLPRRDGLSALSEYRRVRPDVVIVMLTGLGDIPLAVEAVREGADTLLTKPIDPDKLLATAGELKARGRPVLPTRRASTYNLEEVERETIHEALKQCGNNIARAAALLGIDRRTLQRKLKRIG